MIDYFLRKMPKDVNFVFEGDNGEHFKTSKCDFSKDIHLNKKKKESCIENQKTFKT